jgi:hypothetical protein
VLFIIFLVHKRGRYVSNDALVIPFDLLIQTRELLEKLFEQADKQLMKEKPLLNCYLRSLAYFKEIFQPEIQLLEPDHYEIILNSLLYFERIRSDFLNDCEYIYLEFTNELDEIELEKVASFKRYQRSIEGGFRNHKYLLIENIILLKDLFSKCDSLAIKAYRHHHFFLKSIVLNGPCIERLLCLHLLTKFCQVEKIKEKIFGDKKLIEDIKGLFLDLNENRLKIKDRFKTRYNNVLKDFLKF